MPTESILRACATTIHVIATTLEGASNALAVAIPLARSRRARLNVALVQIVPVHAALEVSSTDEQVVRSLYRHLLQDLGGEGDIDVLRCHSWNEMLEWTPPAVTTIVGGPLGQPLLPSAEEALADQLTGMGRQVVFVPSYQ